MTIDQTTKGGLCECPSAPVPHRHPTQQMLDAMRNAGTAATVEQFSEALDVPGDEALEQLRATMLPPRPPASIPQHETRPLNLIQVTRRDALRLSISHHRATEEEFDDLDVLATAERFTDFIRSGVVPTREQEA